MTLIRRTSIVALALLIGASLAPAVASAAQDDPSPADELRKELKYINDGIPRLKLSNDDVVAYLDSFAKQYVALDAADKDTAKLRSGIRKVMLKALRTTYVRKEVNQRADVNIRAAVHLGTLAATFDKSARASVFKAGMTAITKMKKAKYELRPARIEAVAAMLAQTHASRAITYISKEHLRTDNTKVEFTIAGLKALRLIESFTSSERFDLFMTLKLKYEGVESTAEQSSSSANVRSKKELWDQIRTHVIANMQTLARTPKSKKGVALQTMQEFQEWFRDHKSAKGEPWVLPKTAAATK